VATGTLVRTFHAPDGKWYNANTVAFTPDGTRVIAGHMDGKLSVWDSQTGQRLGLVSRHDRQITAVAISSDEKTLYTGGTDGQVICSLVTDPGSVLWRQRVGEGEPRDVPDFGGTSGVADIALTPDGRHIVAGVSKSGTILVLRADTGELVREITELRRHERALR
jgi:WD40 repeat protein